MNPSNKGTLTKPSRDQSALSHPAAGELLVFFADAMARFADGYRSDMDAKDRLGTLAASFKAAGRHGGGGLSREVKERAEGILFKAFEAHFDGKRGVLSSRAYAMAEWTRAYRKAMDATHTVLFPESRPTLLDEERDAAVKRHLKGAYQRLIDAYPQPKSTRVRNRG